MLKKNLPSVVVIMAMIFGWISGNKDWLFSGAIFAVVSYIIAIAKRRKEIQHKDSADVIPALQAELQEKNEQIKSLKEQLSEASERHDTIVLQLTYQLENQQKLLQKLLEYHQQPWYRRRFKK